MSGELETKKTSHIRLNDDALDKVTKNLSEKTGISIEQVRTELGIGFILGVMMNKHRIQEIEDKRYNED